MAISLKTVTAVLKVLTDLLNIGRANKWWDRRMASLRAKVPHDDA